MQNNTWKEWFVFTKRDRNAAIILLSIISIVILLPYLLPAKKLEISIDKDLQQQLDEYQQNHQAGNNQHVYTAAADTTIKDTAKTTLFFFDPNTLNEEGFTKLGLSQKTIHTLINYRSKGGYFKTPEDIRKIYSLSKIDADRLIPYIRIASNTTQLKQEYKTEQPVTNTTTHQYKKININTASAGEWKTFPGIGDVIANRIVKYRASMGSFKTVEQVGKTYGLSDSVFQLIKPYLYIKDSANTDH